MNQLLTWLACGALAATGSAQPDAGDTNVPADANMGRLEKCQYVSRIDGAIIEYALWYPPGYDASEPWPLIVFLHGSGEGGGWEAPTDPDASIPVKTVRRDLPFLVAFPVMRGSWSVNGPAELDVLDTIRDVQKRAHVDPDRIHLTGLSLGGFAGWAIAAHYPHLFATLSVFASGGQPELVRNLRHVPTRVYHGLADKTVPVDESRRMVEAMERADLPVTLVAIPGVSHACWMAPYAGHALYDWMKSAKRESQPKRISYRTRSLRHNRAYWATIDSMVEPSRPAVLDVFVPDPSQVLIHTENIGGLTLNPPPAVLPPGADVAFFVNGQPAKPKRTDGGWSWTLGETPAEGPCKRHGLSGPIQDVFYDSFVVVTPGSAPETVNKAWRQAADRAMAWQEQLTFGSFRFVTDAQVTLDTLQSSHLICFGNPDNHLILARTMDLLPLRFSPSGLLVEGGPAGVGVAAFVMIYPNPLNPDRYIVVCSGEPGAVARLAATVLQPPQLASTPIEDLTVLTRDGALLLATPRPPTDAEPEWMAPDPRSRGAVFDRNWRLPGWAVRRLVGPAE